MAEEPPFLLDAARVLAFATLPPGARFSVVVSGVSIDQRSVARLAIVENLVDDRVFLLHCNDTWQTVAAESCADPRAAEAQATSAYSGVPVSWTPYRALSRDETAEMDRTREFLRELAAGGLDE